ncbi:uncharacterized protein TNCT_541521 [Trichonephila clavata]|uniref:Uncharacterized protein n=1 Tax=Trichonephila clavata TaxID=2740835 RepID=A0A8X6M059_TRICU|nr:uncharacterized protein TNCT_541521 [Trichonephila clavata]
MYFPPQKETLHRLILLISFLDCYMVASEGDPSDTCPPENVISPCTCIKVCLWCNVVLKCSNILHQSELQGVFEKSKDWSFSHIYIDDSNFMYITSDEIVKKRMSNLYLKNNNMTSLFDEPPPLTNMLREIYLTNLSLRTGLSWGLFSSLHELRILEVKNTVIPEIEQTFVRNFPQSVIWLFFSSTKTKQLSFDSFSRLTELSRLHVQNTEIKEIQRSMFPTPSKLIDINFRYEIYL